MSSEHQPTDRFHENPISGEQPNTTVNADKHDSDRDRGAFERVELEFGESGQQVARGVTSALDDLGHAGADIGKAVAHGVTGSLTDMGHAVENVGRSFESEETRARHDAHHDDRIEEKYGKKIAHAEYLDARTTEREEHDIAHAEAKRQRHIDHLRTKDAEPYKIADATQKAAAKNARMEEHGAHQVAKAHLKAAHKESKARQKEARKER